MQEWLSALRDEDLSVALPRFSLASRFELAAALQDLGMTTAFTPDADFSGMTDQQELFLSQVVHKTFVDVDEQGTEAAAVILKRGGRAFRADHPFLLLIRDLRNGCVLFMGRVTDPRDA